MTEIETVQTRGLRSVPATVLDTSTATTTAALFKALGDPTRLQMMMMLSNHGGCLCVYDLERHFDLQQPTISHHLRVLRQAGLIDCERRGLWAYYFVCSHALEPLRRVLGTLTTNQ